MRRTLGLSTRVLAAGFVVFGLVGCPDNPYSYKTWTSELGGRDHERAVQELEQLGDPRAIPDIGEKWVDMGKPPRDLQAIISLARPLTKAEAKAKFFTDFEETGREASWDAAMPFLIKAVTDPDESNSRHVDNATKAAEAIGESRNSAGVDALIDLANKPISKKLVQAQVSAVRALGKFDNEKGKASAALIKLIEKDMPLHPSKAKVKEEERGMAEKYELALGVAGAAINALGELQIQTASKPLIIAMYKTPALAPQIRRALVASGPAAKDELRKVLAGTHAEVEALFKDKRLFEYCGKVSDAEDNANNAKCVPLATRDFYAALVLGDFYDPAVVPDLLTALKRPAQPAYFDNGEAGPTQYNALFDAIKKIGSKDAVETVRGMWMASGGPAPAPVRGRPPAKPAEPAAGAPDLMTRMLAIGAYAFVSRDQQGVKELGAIAEDNHADDGLRQAAAESFARLARNPDDIKSLNVLANKYFEASIKKRAEADGKAKTKADAADKVLAAEKKNNEEKKADLIMAKREGKKQAEVKIIEAASKKSDDELKVAKKKHKIETADYKDADRDAKGYMRFAKLFQSHIARIEIAIRCKDDINCYAKTLTEKPDEAYAAASKYFSIDIVKKCGKDNACYKKELQFKPDSSEANVATHAATFSVWSNEEKLLLLEGNVERAMLEIGKKGSAAAGLTETLLDNAKSDNRLIRQSILLALPKIAAIPCNNCEAKLAKAIKAGEGKTTLGGLNFETMMLKYYFSWAGGKTPSKPTAEDEAEIPVEKPAAPPKKADKAEKAEPDKAEPAKQEPAKPAKPAAPAPKKKGK
jgi:hypothetical protein